MEVDHRSLTPVFVGTCRGCPGLHGSAELVNISSEPCPDMSISFSHRSPLLPSPHSVMGQTAWSQSGMEDHFCARDSPAHTIGPGGHGKKWVIVSQYSSLITKKRLEEIQSMGLHESRRVSSCHRKVSDSFLWKLEGRGIGNLSPWWLSIWRSISAHFPCKCLLLKISIPGIFLSDGLFIPKMTAPRGPCCGSKHIPRLCHGHPMNDALKGRTWPVSTLGNTRKHLQALS